MDYRQKGLLRKQARQSLKHKQAHQSRLMKFSETTESRFVQRQLAFEKRLMADLKAELSKRPPSFLRFQYGCG